MPSHGQGKPTGNWFLLVHVSLAATPESSAVFCAPQPQNLRILTSTCSTHTSLYIKKHRQDYINICTHAHLQSLPNSPPCRRMQHCVKIPRRRGGEAGVMPLPLMQFTSSPEPSRSDLLQELIKIPLKNNCKMKQIALSGGQ